MSIDFTKPVRTRNGRPITILTTERKHSFYPVVGMTNDGDIFTFTTEGKSFSDGREHELDLSNVPVRHTREIWANMYPGEGGVTVHTTRKNADFYAGASRIACIHVTITFEEGQGLQP